MTVPPSKRTRIYIGGPRKAIRSYATGAGLESISFDGERKIVNKEWAKRCEHICRLTLTEADACTGSRAATKATPILSRAAKGVIALGDFSDRSDMKEPALMSPSADPEDYSKVCDAAQPSSKLLTGRSGARSAMTLQRPSCCVPGAGSESASADPPGAGGVLSGTQ
jgi:hypothetical protein